MPNDNRSCFILCRVMIIIIFYSPVQHYSFQSRHKFAFNIFTSSYGYRVSHSFLKKMHSAGSGGSFFSFFFLFSYHPMGVGKRKKREKVSRFVYMQRNIHRSALPYNLKSYLDQRGAFHSVLVNVQLSIYIYLYNT